MDETPTSVDAAFVQVKPPNCKFRPTHLDAPRRTPADCNRSPSGALLGSPWGGVRRRQRSIAKMCIVRGVRSLWEPSTLAVGRGASRCVEVSRPELAVRGLHLHKRSIDTGRSLIHRDGKNTGPSFS